MFGINETIGEIPLDPFFKVMQDIADFSFIFIFLIGLFIAMIFVIIMIKEIINKQYCCEKDGLDEDYENLEEDLDEDYDADYLFE